MTVVSDRELVELLADRPELLAIADAVGATQRRRRRLGRRRALALPAAVAALLVLVLAAPWQHGGPSTLERALAAVGQGPVIHAVVETSTRGNALIEIASGEKRPRVHRTEYWYDGERKRLHTRLLVDGVQITEIVETPERAYSDLGSYPTGGAFEPSLEPALLGFVTRYRSALAGGRAKVLDETTVNGRPAKRITLRLPHGAREEVMVDAETYKPLRFFIVAPRVRTPQIAPPASLLRSPEYRVVTIESLPRDPGFFAPPKLSPPRPTAGSGGSAEDVTLDEASRALGRQPRWLGRAFGGHGLDAVLLRHYRAEWTDGRTGEGVVVELSYGGVTLSQAVDPAAAYQLGFDDGGGPPPPPGFLETTPPGTEITTGRAVGPWSAELRSDGIAMLLEAPSRATLLQAARALTPVPR